MTKKAQQKLIDNAIVKACDFYGFGVDAAMQSDNKWDMICDHVNNAFAKKNVPIKIQ